MPAKAINTIITLLLLFNGPGAIYGGGAMILQPDGSILQFPPGMLESSPFSNYMVPGIVLFCVIGLFSLFLLLQFLFRKRYDAKLIMSNGVLVIGWIIIQVLMIRTFSYLQLIIITTGVLLVILGVLLYKNGREETHINKLNN